MIIYLDENSNPTLTDKAFMIKPFRVLFDEFRDKEVAMAHFALMYYMYNFDSKFLREYDTEKARMGAVKKFIYKGSEVTQCKKLRTAMEAYKDIYADETAEMYLVMRRNVDKLKDYADKMVLIDPSASMAEDLKPEFLPMSGVDFILVDSKEFTTINMMLPKQQEELTKFETKLVENSKAKIDIYGGGTKGAFE